MNKNRCIFKKYAITLALAVSAIVFLPKTAFSKGAVIGYACGDQILWPPTGKLASYPSDAQLDRLTHVMAVDLYPDADGFLHTVHMFNRNLSTVWNGNDIDPWLSSLVTRAHLKNVKVSIVISHSVKLKGVAV